MHCDVTIENKDNAIHAIAILHAEAEVKRQLVSSICQLPAGLCPSQAVRKQALQLLQENGYFNCCIVRKEEQGRLLPPEVTSQELSIACDLSLSHDGRWVSTALLLTPYCLENYATV